MYDSCVSFECGVSSAWDARVEDEIVGVCFGLVLERVEFVGYPQSLQTPPPRFSFTIHKSCDVGETYGIRSIVHDLDLSRVLERSVRFGR